MLYAYSTGGQLESKNTAAEKNKRRVVPVPAQAQAYSRPFGRGW
jgi:hypothetical protein